MHTLITVIIFLAVLAILVLVHELGHFLAAKKFGIRVDEFGLGFPPKIFGKKFGETEYSLNWIPFGGFVRIFGERPDDESSVGPDSKRSLIAKPWWQQIIVLVAGIVFNFIFAWILLSLAFMFGVAGSAESYKSAYPDRFHDERVTVAMVDPASPAAAAGIKAGDTLLGAKYGTIEVEKFSVDNFREAINKSAGVPIEVSLKRGNEIMTREVVAKRGVITDQADKYAIGIIMDEVGTLRLPIHYAVYEGGRLTIKMLQDVTKGLGALIVGALTGHGHLSNLTGPVGIAGLVGDMARLGISYLFMLTALISINLGIINLVPFPALDGGRILFVLIEAIRRKPISHKFANAVNAVGMMLLLLLMLVITVKDIWTLWK